MSNYIIPDENFLMHHGIKGQRWGVRRFQNADGSRTSAGKRRYGIGSDVKTSKPTDNKIEKPNRTKTAVKTAVATAGLLVGLGLGVKLSKKLKPADIDPFKEKLLTEQVTNMMGPKAKKLATLMNEPLSEVDKFFMTQPDITLNISSKKVTKPKNTETLKFFKDHGML